jgi:hypothetical protein
MRNSDSLCLLLFVNMLADYSDPDYPLHTSTHSCVRSSAINAHTCDPASAGAISRPAVGQMCVIKRARACVHVRTRGTPTHLMRVGVFLIDHLNHLGICMHLQVDNFYMRRRILMTHN